MFQKSRGLRNESVRSRSTSRERVSLLGKKSKIAPSPSSGNGAGLHSRGNRSKKVDEEKVSLLSPGQAKRNQSDFRRRKRGSKFQKQPLSWTKRRVTKYIALLLVSALMSYWMLRKESRIIEWNNEFEMDGKCFEEGKTKSLASAKKDAGCTCPEPHNAMENKDVSRWKSNHDHMVHQAKNAPKDLDIVFFGDDIVEQLSGTRDLGKEMMDGIEDYFDKTFNKKNRAKFNAIALGSTGDTGPNLLWHWENGIQQANLRPKLWFLVVGGNDLYQHKCANGNVMANVLNVAKRIYDHQEDAKIVIHGLFPRKDDLDAKSNNLGDLWLHAQGINIDVRKFIKKHSNRIYFMNLGQTLMANSGMKGRKAVNPRLIQNGFATSEGVKKWGDLAVKKLTPIIKGFDREAHRKKKKTDAAKEQDGDAPGQ